MFCVQPTCTCECIWLKTLIIEPRQTSNTQAKQRGSYSTVASSRGTAQILCLTTPVYHDHYYTTHRRGYWSPHGSRAPTALSFDYVVDSPPGTLSLSLCLSLSLSPSSPPPKCSILPSCPLHFPHIPTSPFVSFGFLVLSLPFSPPLFKIFGERRQKTRTGKGPGGFEHGTPVLLPEDYF